MSTQVNPVSGDEKDAVVAKAEGTSEFQAYHDYFVDQLEYNISEIDVIERQSYPNDTNHIVSFLLDDDRPDTTAGFNILLEDHKVVESNGSIDHYEDGEIVAVDTFSYEYGEIKQNYLDVSNDFPQ